MVNLHKLLVPLINVGGLAPRVILIIAAGRRVMLVVLAPLDDLLQDRLIDLRGKSPSDDSGLLVPEAIKHLTAT